MAVTGFWPVFKDLKATLDYADNPDKTTDPEYLDEDLYAALRYAENDDIARSTTRRSHCRRNCLPPLPRPCSRSCVSFTPATRAGPILQSGS